MRGGAQWGELSGADMTAQIDLHPSITQSEMDMSTSEFIQDERIILQQQQQQQIMSGGRENYVLEDKITEIVNSED